MTIDCRCGGRYKRTDIKPVWSEAYRKFLYVDSDPLVVHWSCDRCGAPRTQRKRQAKEKSMERQLLDLISQLGDDMNKSDHGLLNLIEVLVKRMTLLEEVVQTMLNVQKEHLELSKSS